MAVEVDVELTRRLFTIEEYVRMWDEGVFDPEERLELIEGEVVVMSPTGDPHAAFVDNLTHLLVHAVGDSAIVRCQGPLRLPPRSLPLPDFTLLRPGSYKRKSATADDVFLVVEVADTSLRIDRSVKLRLYARAGIREYWVVDAKAETLEIHRSPSGDGYTERRNAGRDERVTPLALPDAVIDVAAIFV